MRPGNGFSKAWCQRHLQGRARRPGHASTARRLRSIIAFTTIVLFTSSCDWTGFGFGPAHGGDNPGETAISVANVHSLTERFSAVAGSNVDSSPAIANGTVFVGSDDHKLYAFDAKGNTGCAGSPRTCAPLWTSVSTGSFVFSSPAVANGVVYVGSNDGTLYAFDASGTKNCSGSQKICSPLWTASAGIGSSSPEVANGVVYVGSAGGTLQAFDAAGVTNCAGAPTVCTPLWIATTGSPLTSSPAIAGGVVYVSSYGGKLYAYDASGTSNCSGSPRVCGPLWTSASGFPMTSSPTVAHGVVYVGSVSYTHLTLPTILRV